MNQTTSETAQILNRLRCCCGHEKTKGLAICRACYKFLPEEQRLALYRHQTKTFLEAYTEAVEWLRAYSPTFQIRNTYWDGQTLRVNPS